MERQSSSSSTSTEFIILQQVKFLELDDHPLFHWELVDILDKYERADSDPNPHPILYRPHHDDDQDHADRDPHFTNHDDDDDDDVNVNLPQLEENGRHLHHHHGYDENDELVLWEVSNEFWGQRMKKLGRSVFSKKKADSKRSSTVSAKRGSVRRKQGHRLKNSYRRSFIPEPFEE